MENSAKILKIHSLNKDDTIDVIKEIVNFSGEN
jgi:hypothetical protein